MSVFWRQQSELWHREFDKMVETRDRLVTTNTELLTALGDLIDAVEVYAQSHMIDCDCPLCTAISKAEDARANATLRDKR
jgi:hypothetical protein